MRPRCLQCGKIPRGKTRNAEYLRYEPFCSFHCQETGRMQNALRYVKTLHGGAAPAPSQKSEPELKPMENA